MDPDHRPAHACKHCQRIVLRPEHFDGDICKIKISYNGSEIWRAVEEGCVLFRLFFANGLSAHSDGVLALEEAIRRETSYYSNRISTILEKVGELRSLRKARQWSGKFYVVIANNEGQFDVPTGKVVFLQYEKTKMYGTCMSVKASPGFAAVQLANHLETAQHPFLGDDYSLRKAHKWLKKCHTLHDLCPGATGDFVPTRLLKVEFDETQMFARLVDNVVEQNPRWAALTYVWGGDQKFKATLSFLSTLKEKFDVHRLPQTIQDALTVCRGLELEYLWVDCLCIIQDDPDDLARELAAMPQIYQQAWVTISASTASSVEDGFLHDRGYKTLRDQTPISLPYAWNDGKITGTIIVGEAGAPSTAEQNNSLPIHHRAWTYQERRLSPRILDFTNRNLTFICRTGKRCQGSGSMLWTSPEAGGWKSQQHNIPCLSNQDLPTWYSVVAGYMTRKLTFPGDKLKAIAALADVYRMRTNNTYLAGLWKESLVRDLCWRVVVPDTLSTRSKWLYRPREYRAPSWSWAAVDMNERHEFEFFPSTYAGVDEVHAVAVVWDVSLQQEPRDTTYGHISSGHVRVEGPAIVKNWSYNKGSLKLGQKSVTTTSRDAMEHFWEARRDASTAVTALILIRGKRTHYQEIYFVFFGLLLLKTKRGVYQRVGTFHSSVNVWEMDSNLLPQLDEGFKRKTFTII